MNKRIEFDSQAVSRMVERSISRRDVQWLLAHGTRVPAQQRSQGETPFAREGFLGEKLAWMIHFDRPDHFYISTVMWVTEEA